MSEPEFVDVSSIPLVADERWLVHQQANGGVLVEVPRAFAGLSHAEVLALEFPEERMLVDDLVPIGAVGTIAGVPETYKSWQAQAIAHIVATGQGSVLGKQVRHSGPVGYFWQDDSTREEAERVKLYDHIHGDGSDIPIRWFLNEGLRLPDDIDRLRVTIIENRFELVVLDSFYNVLFGRDLKDEEAEQVIAMLKSEVCDVTNATVLIVDHMPWATQENRKRLRAYGGVFKGAAVRFGIYLDAIGNKLYAEARGNNITGFKRQPAEWDADALELRLVDTKDSVGDEEYEERILEALGENEYGLTTTEMDEITGTKSRLVAARKRLLDARKVVRRKDRTSFSGYVWYLAKESEESGSFTQNELLEDTNWFGSSTGSPLRGDTSDELVSETAAIDDLPF